MPQRCIKTKHVSREKFHCEPVLLSRLVVLESGLGLESGLKSVFAGLGLESYGLGLGLGLGGSASKSFFKSFDEPPPKRQKLFENYMHTREHHSVTATDVSVAELLARYLRAMDGDCDSEPVDFWVRNNATYDKLIPAVRRSLHLPFQLQVHQWKKFSAMGALCYARTEQECPTNFCLNWCF